jgi:hypothetical protein
MSGEAAGAGERCGGCLQSEEVGEGSCARRCPSHACSGKRPNFGLVVAWTSGRVGMFGFARTGRSADERADLCGCDRDGDGARGGEEEARIRQDAPSIAENDDEGDPAGRAANRGERR